MTKHIMIDLETLGTVPGCVILSIGAVVFDPHGPEPLGDTFSVTIDPKNSQAHGFMIDADTVVWWMSQSEEARCAAFSGGRPVPYALECLRRFITVQREGDSPVRIWSHGLTADVVWLEAAYRQIGWETPWTYREPRDTRTVFDLAGVSVKDFATPDHVEHDALSDAKVQALAVIGAIRKLGITAD